jgi:hypothetical protein
LAGKVMEFEVQAQGKVDERLWETGGLPMVSAVSTHVLSGVKPWRAGLQGL